MEINPHNPNFYYNDLTKELTDIIWVNLKNGIKSSDGYIQWSYSNARLLEDHKWFNFNFNVVRSKHMLSDYDIWASAGPDSCYEPTVSFSFVLKKGSHVKRHKIPYAELFGTVAHELHHLAQNNEENAAMSAIVYNEDDPSVMKYFLDPTEIGAFHIGFRAQASISGESLTSIMLKYLRYQKLAQAQKHYIVDQWLNPDFETLIGNLSTGVNHETN